MAATAVLLLAGCTAGVNPTVGVAAPGSANPAGFWLGVWHGMILPITWIVSPFTDTVTPYEVFNSGNWYDVGFVLRISIVFGGPFGHGGRGSGDETGPLPAPPALTEGAGHPTTRRSREQLLATGGPAARRRPRCW